MCKLEKKFRPVRGKILKLNLKITHANYVFAFLVICKMFSLSQPRRVLSKNRG